MNSCTPSPKPIEYGSDMCDYCKMTIVDQQHGAEVVTQKGRVHKFDAIECMIPYLLKQGHDSFSHILVNTYNNPGILIDATNSYYLECKMIPSPMGGFLSAFDSRQETEKVVSLKGGKVFTWEEIQLKYSEQYSINIK